MTAPVVFNLGGAVVARVHHTVVLKYGSQRYPFKARNIRRVQESISIRVYLQYLRPGAWKARSLTKEESGMNQEWATY